MNRGRWSLFVIWISSLLIGCASTDGLGRVQGEKCPLDCEIWAEDGSTCLKWFEVSSGACNGPIDIARLCYTSEGFCPPSRQISVGSSCICDLHIDGEDRAVEGKGYR